MKKVLQLTIILLLSSAFLNAKDNTLFILHQRNEPPFAAKERLASKGEYDQEIMFLFSNNSNVKRFLPVIYTKKKYKTLHIRTGCFIYNDYPDTFLRCAEFLLPDEIHSINDEVSNGWVTDGNFYWLNGFFAIPESHRVLHIWPNAYPFDEEFADCIGTTETFQCTMELWYSFDDEPEKHVVYEFDVEPRKIK